MTKPASKSSPKTVSLDALYALVKDDLARVDSLILGRVKSEVPLIHDIAEHIIRSGGKRIRPALTLISSQLCGNNSGKPIARAAAIEFIHTATLLHDDVVDESKLRRGLATANEMFGNKASVLVGDFLLSQAFQLMVVDGSLLVLGILSDASAVIAKGEVMQLMTEGEPETSLQDYLNVISSKTAVLFAAACELGAIDAGNTNNHRTSLRDFGMQIGMAFQLIDDVLDYAADQATLGKAVGDDFREGKITLPVIIAYNAGNAEEKTFWKRTLADHKQRPGDFAQAAALLSKYNALSQSIAMAEGYCEQARHSIAGFADCPAKSAMLDLIDFCADRAY